MTWMGNYQTMNSGSMAPVVPPAPKPKPMDPYMTVILTRRPKQKTHANIGHVKNAINAKMFRGQLECSIQVYKIDEGSVELLHDFPKGTLAEDIPWVNEARKKREEREARNKELAFSRRESSILRTAAKAYSRFDQVAESDIHQLSYEYGFADVLRLLAKLREQGYSAFSVEIENLERHLTKLP